MARSKSIMPIVKQYKGKRLKKADKYSQTQYEFPTVWAATQATWAIAQVGLGAIGDNKIVTVYR